MASNADLLAVNRKRRVSIQVKTTNGQIQDDHSKWLTFGFSTGYVKHGRNFFNSKASPLIADVVVAVHYRPNGSEFVVLPVALAEKICRTFVDYWRAVPAKKRETGKMGERSETFPLWPCFIAPARQNHKKHDEQMMKNLQAFRGKWSVLDEDVEKLHDPKAWPLLN